MDIIEFRGEYRWLSNFSPVRIVFDGIVYPSVEHAYMSAKSDSKDWKTMCSNPDNKPGYIKKQSKNIKLGQQWHSTKVDVMKYCLKQKFSQEPYKSNLLNTGDSYIQEGNTWGDKFWGVCLKTNEGENNLGKIIMDIRSNLLKTENENL